MWTSFSTGYHWSTDRHRDLLVTLKNTMKALWRKKLGRPSFRSSSASSRQPWLPSELRVAWATAQSHSEHRLVNLSASAISHTRGCGFLFFIKRDFVTFDFVTLRASQLWMSSKLSDSQQYIAWYRNLCRNQNTCLFFYVVCILSLVYRRKKYYLLI